MEKKYEISISQMEFDINNLEYEFTKMGGAWENEDGDAYGCTPIAEKELELVKGIASRYPFFWEYNPSEYGKNSEYYEDEWYAEDTFTVDDFNQNNVTIDNYGKVDAVAFVMQNDLIDFLKQLIQEIKWLPSRFEQEFITIICEAPQTATSIRKNAEYFSESILDELTEKEKRQMFVAL